MDAELKTKWVAALRGGEYHQAHNLLDNGEGGNCCLGVLNAVAGKSQTYSFCSRYGISYADESTLIRMNDDDDKTFPEIADYIEANL